MNAVAPGIIETDMSERLREHATKELMRLYRPIALVKHLKLQSSFCSIRESSGYITGQTIGIDGGLGL